LHKFFYFRFHFTEEIIWEISIPSKEFTVLDKYMKIVTKA
jgi:hypothetical protein